MRKTDEDRMHRQCVLIDIARITKDGWKAEWILDRLLDECGLCYPEPTGRDKLAKR